MMDPRWFAPNTFVIVAALGAAVTACARPSADDAPVTSISELSNALCADAPNWIANAPYARGAMVRYEGEVYECLQAHTSFAHWTPAGVPALWSKTFCGAGGSTAGSSTGSATPTPPPPAPPPPPPPPTPQPDPTHPPHPTPPPTPTDPATSPLCPSG